MVKMSIPFNNLSITGIQQLAKRSLKTEYGKAILTPQNYIFKNTVLVILLKQQYYLL